MTVAAALIVFGVVSAFAWVFSHRIPSLIFRNLEYFLVCVGLVGVLAALSQITADARETRSLALVNDARELFGAMMQRVEYRMDGCGVWWDVALDQTNKEPEKCKVSKECEDACRIGHMVSQYRWRPIDTQVGDWDNFRFLVCGTPSTKPIDALCGPATEFLDALNEANNSKRAADSQLFSSEFLLTLVQFMAAIGLGLEIGKLGMRRRTSAID